MAKIEWEKIEGYRDGMSAEEKLSLLDNYGQESPNPVESPVPEQKDEPKPALKESQKVISKSQFDKIASELAAAKKQLRAKMTEDEIKESERQQEQESMKQELETLRREKTLSSYKAQYLALGYGEPLAAETAEAMADGDMDAVFLNMKKQGSVLEKSLRAEILKETPAPPAGANPDKEDLDLFAETFMKG